MTTGAEPAYENFGLYVGLVIDNVDSEKTGKIKVQVPGLLEPHAEARVSMPGSPFSNGIFVLPSIGSEVLVGFLNGEIDAPVVLGGFAPPVASGGARAGTKAEDLPKLIVIENEDFVLTMGKRDTAAPYFSVSTRPDADGKVMRLVMASSGLIEVFTTDINASPQAGISVRTTGLLSLDGNLMQVRQRPVQEGTDPI